MIHSSGPFYRPNSFLELNQIIGSLQEKGDKFIFYAGGTDVVPYLKKQGNNNNKIISLNFLEDKNKLIEVSEEQDFLYIGALMALSEVSKNKIINEKIPSITKTVDLIASPQIRNKATVGGNILVDNRCVFFNQSELNRESHNPCIKDGGEVCHLIKSANKNDFPSCRARSVSDLVPSLLILDTSLILNGINGEREIKLRDFFKSDGIQRNYLEEGEVLTQIKIPLLPNKTMYYEKLRIREAIDFPSLGVAVGKNNNFLEIAITGVDTSPKYYCFNQNDFSNWDELIKTASKTCMKDAAPLKQDFFPPAYRKKMIAIFIKRICRKFL